MSLTVVEIITYIILIYLLCFLFVFIVPNVVFLLLLFVGIFVGSWLTLVGCESSELNNFIVKFFVLAVYSLLCVALYLMIHYNWTNTICKIFIVVLPILFYFFVISVQKIFNCDDYHVLMTPVRIIKFIVDMIKSFTDEIKTSK